MNRHRKQKSCSNVLSDHEIKTEPSENDSELDSMEQQGTEDAIKSHDESHCESNEAMEVIEDIFVKEESRLHFDCEHPFEEIDQSTVSREANQPNDFHTKIEEYFQDDSKANSRIEDELQIEKKSHHQRENGENFDRSITACAGNDS